jgi:PhnB protein
VSSQDSKTTPAGYNVLNPYITVKNVAALIEFLQSTFGGVLTGQIKQPDGRIEHAEVRIGDSLIMVGPPQVDALIRTHEETRPGTFYVFVSDADSTYEKAITCGAGSWSAPAETFYGDRVAAVTDTNGNVWWIATRKEILNAEQLQARADQRWHKRGSTV